MSYYLGIDFGTSGARAIVIDEAKTVVFEVRHDFLNHIDERVVIAWQTALDSLIEQIPKQIRQQLKAIAIDGTSSTVLLCDADGIPVTEPILYNDSRGKEKLSEIREVAPANHVVISATSSLAKLWWWYEQTYFSQAVYLLHQADWLAFLLHGKLAISDYHNALKLGYDVENLCYPDWLINLPFSYLFPQVLPPGTPIAEITPENSDRFNLPSDCKICAGTTDSIAAFLASGANQAGQAVTSLGSSLVLKLLSDTKVEAASYGIYSHRLGELWLTGGASNTGGAVLKHFFNERQLRELSRQIDPNAECSVHYYPLLRPGDRFPINDPNLPPKLTPRPTEPKQFLHGLLVGIARIEALGYQKLQELGASQLTKIYTTGGGANNPTWQQIRQGYFNIPVRVAPNTEAAFGTALLAKEQIN